jgi:FAD dependent oxidoreductase TIGR03364
MKGSRYDLAVVGAGIAGLAHALAGARQGMRVVVFDRDTVSNGASIRNFGFITVTGQSRGLIWQRARRTRDIWQELATPANIPIVHRNECLIVHSSEAMAVLEEFIATEMGEGCELLDARGVVERVPMTNERNLAGGLWSPHELRIEARDAIPALATYLESNLGVEIRRGTAVRAIASPEIETSDGGAEAERVVVAPGPDLVTLFPDVHARHGTRLCKLHMLRLGTQPVPWRLPASIMSDFGLIRYRGFSELRAVTALRRLLSAQEPRIIGYGIHLIVVQSADGSLVVGDSHDYDGIPNPFFSSDVEDAMLGLAESVLRIPNRDVTERWIGIYPQSESCEWFVESPDPSTRVVQVTAGNGMSTAFALAEEVLSAF